MTVISLAAKRAEREPHWEGACVCVACRHEWRAVGALGTFTGLQCPSCELPKGVVKYFFGADAGDMELRCDCGCEALTAYKRARDGLKVLRCMNCGTDLTNTYFG